MADIQLKLGAEFPEPSLETWRELAVASLKGASFEKVLVSSLFDGIKLQPLYTVEDLEADSRSIHEVMVASCAHPGAWGIRQLHRHPDPAFTNRALLADLENGADSLLIEFDSASRHGRLAADETAGEAGVMLYCLEDVKLALDGFHFSMAAIGIEAGTAAIPAAALLAAAAAEVADSARLELNLDPLGNLASTGFLPTDIESSLAELGQIALDVAKQYPLATVVRVNTTRWSDAGATDGTELAIAVASGVVYLRTMVEAGMSVSKAANRIRFAVAVGTDFFSGIAKLRALRLMWNRVLEASGASSRVNIDAVSAEHVLSKNDPWVNLLRNTVSSFAAGAGGADTVMCLPFDHAIGLPDDFSQRMARNTQLILLEESNVHQVLDPAGGSFYLESLTRELASVAWGKFREMEKSGGLIPRLRDGSLVREVAGMWAARQKRLATRRDPLTGVSEFPNIDEEAIQTLQPDLLELRQAAQARLTTFSGSIGRSFADLIAAARAGANIQQLYRTLYGESAGESVPALVAHRQAEDFEALRERVERHKAAGGTRAEIFLANIGRIAEHTARASFARNFFEAGGIKAFTTDGFADADAMGKAFRASQARMAVICGSDTQYESFAEPFARVLKDSGAIRVFLAGRPGDKADAYARAGIDEYVGLGSDVLAICHRALENLGVKE